MTSANGATQAAKPSKKTTTKKGKKGKEDEVPSLTIPKIELGLAIIPVMSASPVISHRFSQKMRALMLAKQMGKAQHKKEPKNPEQDFLDSFDTVQGDYGPRPELYVDEVGITRAQAAEGNPFAIRSLAFKSAIVDACRHVDGVTMVGARGAFHVLGEFVEILHDEDPVMREDVVRLSGPGGVADLRYRGMFNEWSCRVPIRYNSRSITLEQIVNLVSLAGFSSGVCEWRPERSGNFGMFEVDVAAFEAGV